MLSARSRVLRRRAGGEDVDEDATEGVGPDEGAGPAEAADSTDEGRDPLPTLAVAAREEGGARRVPGSARFPPLP